MILKPKGTNDILPSEVYKWHHIEKLFRKICEEFGFEEMRTPAFEYTSLFKRGVGETTDIVQKEMFNVIPSVETRKVTEGVWDAAGFKRYLDKDGMTLKPEGTAPVVRAFVENKMHGQGQLHKFYYITPCFRHERPQAGRMRAFHQFGIEIFGTMSATADAEVIALADTFIKRVGLMDVKLHINSIGCPTCRPQYNETLKAYLAPKLPKLCDTCNDRFDKNPMRILDCKNPDCQAELHDAPHMIDSLCDECAAHFEDVKSMLTAMTIDFTVDTGIVRGLDYYTKTAFEFISEDIGAQSTVSGGGRYDGLVAEVGGPEIPGVGFGMGMERLLLTMQNTGIEIPKPMVNELFIIVLGEQAKRSALAVAKRFRDAGIKTEIDHLGRSMKAQFKYANKIEVPYVIILGDDEVTKGVMPLKCMADGTQIEIGIDDVEKGVALIQSKQEA
ncbi:histidine--tRNA ligase [Fusibacter paucivorans]|uniref:Histidine--tRNA ligase n=1 Tax=Fusibacter paucivorans TaxID=76009 RepID=A0ABS5PRE3_9FIRM|nr:histidine--tRNA ligase [Fusibacter paucivorans]MBS7527738.1 histidine--tRNA ligase [Fusibacter paucivorans]